MDLKNNQLPISPHDNNKKKKTPFIYMVLMSLKTLFIYMVSMFSLGSILVFVMFYQIRPPFFDVNSFDVSLYNISIADPFNTSSLSSITATWNIDFIVKNPNVFTKLSYEPQAISVYHGGEKLSSTIIAPFHQSSTQKHVVAMVHASTNTIFSGEVAYAFAKDWTRGTVGFNVTVDTRVKLHPKFFFKQSYEVDFCEEVKVGVSSNKINGTLLGGSVTCYQR